MIKPISGRALPNYHIHIVFSDGAEGEVDLSDLVGHGVFEAWKDPGFFEGGFILGPADKFGGVT